LKYSDHFGEIVAAQKSGRPAGIASICSYNKYVMEAVFQQALEEGNPVLIESTSNQVNQFGGYTGMKPDSFREYIFSIARSMKFPIENIILGGDHLGPFPFRDEPESAAMEKSVEMVEVYVSAGCKKIHIDTSMSLGDDPGGAGSGLDPAVVAQRCARLCSAAEKAYDDMKKLNRDSDPPVYVIGTEVPAPGGSDEVEEGVSVTKVSEFEETVSITKELFYKHKLERAWERVIAVVVQPGVEFGDHTIVEYNRAKARDLAAALKRYQGIVFEGHSTDYQSAQCLKEMVEDGVAILKVGPALTFAVREAVYMLNNMEEELFKNDRSVKMSDFIESLDRAMSRNPVHWKKYYTGPQKEVELKRRYSFFDRIRYYWPDESVNDSLKRLIGNLRSADIPISLISQFFPRQYSRIRKGLLENDPEALIRDSVRSVLDNYSYAVSNKKDGT
jgi:D-tagatose-1,6-bisphosphate aldolase subunit GatZ/KbaZ